MTPCVKPRERGGCLTLWLIASGVLGVYGLFAVYSASPGRGTIQSGPLLVLLAHIAFIYGAWNWKWWGVYGLVATTILGGSFQFFNHINSGLTYVLVIVQLGTLCFLVVSKRKDFEFWNSRGDRRPPIQVSDQPGPDAPEHLRRWYMERQISQAIREDKALALSGALSVLLALVNFRQNEPLIAVFQLAVGMAMIAVVLLAGHITTSRAVTGLIVVFGASGLWNVALALSVRLAGFGIAVGLLGAFQLRWAYQMFRLHRMFEPPAV